MDMFNKFDNLPPDYIPCNTHKPKDFKITIMVGETSIHTFDIPFNVEESCNQVEILYKLGTSVILTKVPNPEDTANYDCWIDGRPFSSIQCTLSPEDTSKFRDTLLEAQVQIKFTMKDGSILYSEIYPVEVTNSLDYNLSGVTYNAN